MKSYSIHFAFDLVTNVGLQNDLNPDVISPNFTKSSANQKSHTKECEGFIDLPNPELDQSVGRLARQV